MKLQRIMATSKSLVFGRFEKSLLLHQRSRSMEDIRNRLSDDFVDCGMTRSHHHQRTQRRRRQIAFSTSSLDEIEEPKHPRMLDVRSAEIQATSKQTWKTRGKTIPTAGNSKPSQKPSVKSALKDMNAQLISLFTVLKTKGTSGLDENANEFLSVSARNPDSELNRPPLQAESPVIEDEPSAVATVTEHSYEGNKTADDEKLLSMGKAKTNFNNNIINSELLPPLK